MRHFQLLHCLFGVPRNQALLVRIIRHVSQSRVALEVCCSVSVLFFVWPVDVQHRDVLVGVVLVGGEVGHVSVRLWPVVCESGLLIS